MSDLTRRELLARFAAMAGCYVVSAGTPFAAFGRRIRSGSRHRFPQGVASGDPTPESVVLWTRVEPVSGGHDPVDLRLQVARSPRFETLVVDRPVRATAASDHTVRVLVDRLDPSTVYRYRFVTASGDATIAGRTRTAPSPDDPRSVSFAMVSCQHVQLGYMTPYRRMIAEDAERPEEEQIQFVLHLGDFIYEEAWYPEEVDGTFLRRLLRDTIRFPDGGQLGTLRYPVSLADYRHLYRTYLSDPDLQAARARWPFVCTWDDHEFSNNAWQSQEMYDGDGLPAQSRKVAANQAWFEYIPALLTGSPGVPGVEPRARDFTAVEVRDVPLSAFDDEYRSLEPNNREAIHSLVIYRNLRWGANVELLITDNRSFRSPPVPGSVIADQVTSSAALWFYPQDVLELLDAGRTAHDGNPPRTFTCDGKDLINTHRDLPPGTCLGSEQKEWFLASLAATDVRWKLWANAFGAMTRRADFHELPADLRALWPGSGHGVYGNDDWDSYAHERRELLDFVAERGIANVVSLAGDRHNFTAGYLSGSLEPGVYRPVAIELGVSSITTPTSFEAFEYVTARRPTDLEALFVQRSPGRAPRPMLNMLFTHGVASCLAYVESGDRDAALARSNPELAPHLPFIDTAHHGYATVEVGAERLTTEFVAMEAPLEPYTDEGGPPVVYRLEHRVDAWPSGDAPHLRRRLVAGTPPFPLHADDETA